MAFIPDQQINTGLYVATTDVWEVSRIMDVDVNSEEFRLLLVRLYQNINNIAIALNLKDSALYVKEEFIDGQQFFSITTNPNDLRMNFRKVIDMGALAAGVKTIAHGLTITTPWQFTRIYGAATNTTTGNYYPLPFAGAAGNNIELRLDNTNVIIDNASGVTFEKCYVIVEYLKN